MLVEWYKEFLSESYSDKEKELIINDLFILSELILENEDLSKIINKKIRPEGSTLGVYNLIK
jgi:hypothetical protein